MQQKENEIIELQRQLTKVKENPFLEMPEDKIEELIKMAQDWKAFKEQLPDAQYIFK